MRKSYALVLSCLGLGAVAALAVAEPPTIAVPVAIAAPPTVTPPLDPSDPTFRRAKHVLIISEDGMPGGAISKGELKWHEVMKKRGSYTFRAMTIRDASTLPAHASMLSGYHPSVHGLTWNNWKPKKGYIKTQTIFTRAADKGMTTAFFTGKSKLRHIVPPGKVGMYERPGYFCKKVAQDAAEYLITEKPELAFVHFSDPDEVGHAKGWGSVQQQKAIEESDRCLGILIDALDRNGLAGDTLIILSADHGGHNHVHSGGKLIDREIGWMAVGPGVRPGYHMLQPVSTLDTAATALYALGINQPPDISGKPRTEIFLDSVKDPAKK